MDYDKYKSKLPFPQKPQEKLVYEYTLRVYGHAGDVAENDRVVNAWRLARDAHRSDVARLSKAFQRDAIDDVGLTGHHLADRIYACAYAQGHHAGLPEVHAVLANLVDTWFPEGIPQNASNGPLARRLRAGRGGVFHQKVINRIFKKLSPQESQVLSELVGNLEEDAKRDEGRRQRRFGRNSRG